MKSTVQYNSAFSIKNLTSFRFYEQTPHKRSKAENKLPSYLHYTIYTKQYFQYQFMFSPAVSSWDSSHFVWSSSTVPSSCFPRVSDATFFSFETIQFFKVSVGDRQYWACRFVALYSCQVKNVLTEDADVLRARWKCRGTSALRQFTVHF